MGMLCFFPWATCSEPLRFGVFDVVPYGAALDRGEIPAEHEESVVTILRAYGHKREVDQREIPLLRHAELALTADLSQDEISDYFAFRTRLTCAVLAARRFFSYRYANSDNIRLVIQGFVPDRPGAALVQHRRRDGFTQLIIPKGRLSVPKPEHVSDRCELPRDLDSALLTALESAAAGGTPSWPRLAEAIRLFIGANTDSSQVDMHAELIDVMSAFSRVADAWDDKGTVRGFLGMLPRPAERATRDPGPKRFTPALERALAKGESVRAVWLKDAYVLRSQFGHGRVENPDFKSVWNEREHLLLSAVAFPLYVKAVLAKEGLYSMTDVDEAVNIAFDELATLDPFAASDEDEPSQWNEVLSRARFWQLAASFGDDLGEEDADEE